MTVRFQPTPNPNAGKFIADREIVPGDRPRSFFSREDAAGDRLAEALMALDGVASIFMVEDFVTVTKEPNADWGALIPRVEAAIRRSL
ncbi:MAG TPA: NifU N-terminal domain-containing protein [Longimicrobiales bacterium]